MTLRKSRTPAAMQCRGAASSLAAQLARLSLAASKLASILQLRGAAFVYVYYLVANGGGRQGPKNIGVATHKRRAKGARCERVPYCLSEGPFSSSMEKHCERPGSPSAQGGLLFSLANKKTISAGLAPICPLSATAAVHCSSELSFPPGLSTERRLCSVPVVALPPFFPPRSAVFRPCQFSVPPSVDDRSCDAAAAASVKMVVSCLHNGSGVKSPGRHRSGDHRAEPLRSHGASFCASSSSKIIRFSNPPRRSRMNKQRARVHVRSRVRTP